MRRLPVQFLLSSVELGSGEKGFELASYGMVNMFPHTLHAEAVALFVR